MRAKGGGSQPRVDGLTRLGLTSLLDAQIEADVSSRPLVKYKLDVDDEIKATRTSLFSRNILVCIGLARRG